MHTATTRRFHQKTAALTAQFLRTAKHMPSVVTMNCFAEICTHLNPLVQLPSLPELRVALRNIEGNVAPCIICGVGHPAIQNLVLKEYDAAMYLTTYVLTKAKTLEQAKRDMVQEKLTICVLHTRSACDEMLNSLKVATEMSGTGEIDNHALFEGNVIFNKLINMRKLYNEENLLVITSEDYRQILEEWLVTARPTRKRKTKHHRKSESASEQEFDGSMEREEQMVQNPPVEEPPVEEEKVADEKAEVPEKQVKQEEPDYEEVPETPPTLVVPPPPSKPIIYTLKNGKKVMKAPLAAAFLARQGIGKLVTYRVAKKRVIEPPVEAPRAEPVKEPAPAKEEVAPLIRRVEYTPSRTYEQFEERKPEFFQFDESSLSAPNTHS